MQLSAEKNNCYLQTIDECAIDDIWQEIEPQFADLCRSSQGRFTSSDILKSIKQNTSQLWLARDNFTNKIIMALTTEVRIYPTGNKYLFISDIVGEDYKRWFWILENITQWAKEIGCYGLEAKGRLGWFKIMKDWDKQEVIFTKVL